MDLLWLLKFQLKLEVESLALVAVIAWCLWYSWNQVHLGGAQQSAWHIFQWAWTYLEEFQLANHLPTQPRFVSEVLWSPPKPLWFKVNIDSAVFSSLKSVGVGIVVRDQWGNVAAAMSKLVNAPLGPLETEAMVMEEAIQFARDTGFLDVIFESDSLSMIQSLNGSLIPPASIVNIISGSLQAIRYFGQVEFVYVPRTGNKAAHGLAQ
ncbi:uncharacterized protein LOC115991254 [Quercus lobata]|uniref:uncharacterized protein LOC115991254 n=1 Tax=Quercus lobata TaxID=97700 RepID=UPI0012487A6A|nr:uncharacterized protein LOC115991254 [Quercus lobata]